MVFGSNVAHISRENWKGDHFEATVYDYITTAGRKLKQGIDVNLTAKRMVFYFWFQVHFPVFRPKKKSGEKDRELLRPYFNDNFCPSDQLTEEDPDGIRGSQTKTSTHSKMLSQTCTFFWDTFPRVICLASSQIGRSRLVFQSSHFSRKKVAFCLFAFFEQFELSMRHKRNG